MNRHHPAIRNAEVFRLRYPALAEICGKRIERAVAIAMAPAAITTSGNSTWYDQSQSNPGKAYTVNTHEHTCTCYDSRTTRPCKHRIAIALLAGLPSPSHPKPEIASAPDPTAIASALPPQAEIVSAPAPTSAPDADTLRDMLFNTAAKVRKTNPRLADQLELQALVGDPLYNECAYKLALAAIGEQK